MNGSDMHFVCKIQYYLMHMFSTGTISTHNSRVKYHQSALRVQCIHCYSYTAGNKSIEKKLVKWNPYIVDTIGELHVGRYRGPAIAERFYKYYTCI